jgi:hypothetical protein
MGLFDRRKRDESKPETAETELDQPAAEDEPAGPATWYRTKYMVVVPAGDDVLLHDPERDEPVPLPTFELDLLAQCNHFAPIEEHAAIAGGRTGLPADGVAQRLYEMVDRGLLVSKQEVMTRARAAVDANPGSAPTLDRIAVITNDRTASLTNCLRSYRERYGEDVELVIFDDSVDDATRSRNQRAAAQAGAGERLLYAGADEKRQFAGELAARSGVEQEVVRAALLEFDGCTFHSGANRNAVLLDSAGGAVLMVDDDTTARAAYATDAAEGLRLSSRNDPSSLHLFSDVKEALAAADWRDVDLLAWHRRFLGKSPATCAFGASTDQDLVSLDGEGAALDLDEADAALISVFSQGRGRVVLTSAGLAGDSGMGPPLNFLWLQGSERDRLLEHYQSHRATRAVHRCADVATVSSTGSLMTPHVALDLRGIIPPFSPVLRNEDGAFGKMLRACSPDSYLAFLPWAVEHAPPDTRGADFDQVRLSISRVHANTIIANLADAHEPAPGISDPAMRLIAFGRYLTALGLMRSVDFDVLIRYQIMVSAGRRIEALTRTMDQFGGQPDDWGGDCAEIAKNGIRALTEEEIVVADVPGLTVEERNRRFQRAVHRFGRVIEAWPTLLEAAKDLRVAKPLS